MHLCFTRDLAIFSIGFHANLEQTQAFWPFPLQRTRPCLWGSGNHEIWSWNTRLWLLFRKLRKRLEPHSPRRARNPAILTAHWHPIYRYVKEKALLWKPLMSKQASCCKLPADHLQLLNKAVSLVKPNLHLSLSTTGKKKAAWDSMLPNLPNSWLLPGLADALQRKQEPMKPVGPNTSPGSCDKVS